MGEVPPEARRQRGMWMQWIADHREVITTQTSIGTLLGWVVCFKLLANSYRRQL